MSLSDEVQLVQTVLELVCPHMPTEVPTAHSFCELELLLLIESAEQSLHVRQQAMWEVIKTLC